MSFLRVSLSPALALSQIAAGINAKKAADQYADDIALAGEDAARERVRFGVLRAGEITAARAASGVDVRTGSAFDALANNAFRAAMDANRIRYQHDSRAFQAKAEGQAVLMGGINAALRSVIGGTEAAADSSEKFFELLAGDTGLTPAEKPFGTFPFIYDPGNEMLA